METKKRPKIWYDYKKFLLKNIHFNVQEFSILIDYLHSVDFIWDNDVPNDENRGKDGVDQRDYFFRSIGLHDGSFDYPCSVLEMLSAFTIRFGNDWLGYDPDDMEDHYDRIFMMFIKNLGLDEFDNLTIKQFPDCYEEIDYRLERFMKRKYKDDGKGSLFPLKKSVKGFNKTEIYKQIFDFLNQYEIKNTKDLINF